jgi:deoxyribodipyrimidine photolyase-related protein
MIKVSVILPNQLFKCTEHIPITNKVILLEDYLFFRQYNFHKQKLAFHRATMKFYENYLKTFGYQVEYIESHNELGDIRALVPHLI